MKTKRKPKYQPSGVQRTSPNDVERAKELIRSSIAQESPDHPAVLHDIALAAILRDSGIGWTPPCVAWHRYQWGIPGASARLAMLLALRGGKK